MVNTILPLKAEEVAVNRRGRRLLGPINLTFAGPGLTCVLGANGSGKTTLLRALHGMEHLSAGKIIWAQPEMRVRARQAFVFQTPVLLRRSVLENLIYPLKIQGKVARDARESALYWAEKVGLSDLLNMPAQRISGGEKQKLALARALTISPEVLFLDEPCASLDGAATREIEAILDQTKAEIRIIMATHNVGQAKRLASDVLVLSKGKLVEAGAVQDFFAGAQSAQGRAMLEGGIVD